MTKIDYAIMRLKEFNLCSVKQKAINSIDDSNIILGIVCDEMDGEKKNG